MAKTKIINFVLDQTGSMMSVKDETIIGFNEYVKTIKESDESVLFSLTLFNSKEIEERYVAVPVSDVEELTKANYLPNHWTPLYDAIAHSVNAIEDRKADDPGKKDKASVLCVIMTDGLENASKEYNRKDIFDLIKQKEEEDWTFVYLGANQDAWAVGQQMGMSKGNVQSYNQAQTRATFGGAAAASSAYLSNDATPTKSFWKDAEEKNKEEDKTSDWLEK
jgi:hypothetical protein